MKGSDLQTSIPTSALISLELRAKVFAQAKANGMSASAFLRPIVIAAVEEDFQPEEVPQQFGVPVSLRLPISVRQKLIAAAARRGVSMSVLLASIISVRLPAIEGQAH
ncbi:MAG: hypothetical protein O9256_04350 [Rhizobiaceae bacterium]|nr:hypothetical protein [Rhizobiaceae bacterium]MCZ8352967.1 hypothetical protein [Rhizobium sp.]